jgi:hypothetical protein
VFSYNHELNMMQPRSANFAACVNGLWKTTSTWQNSSTICFQGMSMLAPKDFETPPTVLIAGRLGTPQVYKGVGAQENQLPMRSQLLCTVLSL